MKKEKKKKQTSIKNNKEGKKLANKISSYLLSVHLKRGVLFLFALVFSGVIGWHVKNYLDEGDLRPQILNIDVFGETTGSFTFIKLVGISTYLDDNSEYREREEETFLALRELEIGSSDDIFEERDIATLGLLKIVNDRLDQPVTTSIDDVKTALNRAREASDLMINARTEISLALQPLDGAKPTMEENRELFRRIDSNDLLYEYTPYVDYNNSSIEYWISNLSEANETFRVVSTQLVQAIESVSDELDRNLGESEDKLAFDIRVLVANTGNKPIGIMDVAMLNTDSVVPIGLELRSRLRTDELIIPANSHRILTFRGDGEYNEGEMEMAMEQFDEEVLCHIVLVTIDGRSVESQSFPFSSRANYRRQILGLIQK